MCDRLVHTETAQSVVLTTHLCDWLRVDGMPYETLVWRNVGGTHRRYRSDTRRYTSETEALRGHLEVVNREAE